MPTAFFRNDDTEAAYLAELIASWIHAEGVTPEEICILVRSGASAATDVLVSPFRQHGIKIRTQDALQDLLSEPLTTIVLNALSVCCKPRAPVEWNNLCRVLFDLWAVDESSTATQKGTIAISKFLATERQTLQTCTTVADLASWINRLLDFLGRSTFRQKHEQYIQQQFLDQTIRDCAAQLLDAKLRCGTWSAAIDDVLGVGYVPLMSIHKSKGLEYHSVVLIGLEDWPFRGLSRGDGEEECAVFVAFSRAKQRIVITSVEERQGRTQSHDEVARFFDVFARAGINAEEL